MTSIAASNTELTTTRTVNLEVDRARVLEKWNYAFTALSHSNKETKKVELRHHLTVLTVALERFKESEEQHLKNIQRPWYLTAKAKNVIAITAIVLTIAQVIGQSIDLGFNNNTNSQLWINIVLICIAVSTMFNSTINEILVILDKREDDNQAKNFEESRQHFKVIDKICESLTIVVEEPDERIVKIHINNCINYLKTLSQDYIRDNEDISAAIGTLIEWSPDKEVQDELKKFIITPSPSAASAAIPDKGKGSVISKRSNVSDKSNQSVIVPFASPTATPPKRSFLRSSMGDRVMPQDTGRPELSSAVIYSPVDVSRICYVAKENWNCLQEKIGATFSSFVNDDILYKCEPEDVIDMTLPYSS